TSTCATTSGTTARHQCTRAAVPRRRTGGLPARRRAVRPRERRQRSRDACRGASGGSDVPRERRHRGARERRGDEPMKYMLLIYGNEELWGSFEPDVFQEVIRETDAQLAELRRSGEFVGAYGVADQDQARQVHLVDGSPVVTDGPYIEAKEYIGSFTIVDV